MINMDPAAIERAERATRQLGVFLSALQDKRVALVSQIANDEREIEELDTLIINMTHSQETCDRDLNYAKTAKTQFSGLASDVKAEEGVLVLRSRAATSFLTHQFSRAHNDFARAEKEGLCGFSSGPGSTCTQAEARDRDKKFKLLRIERSMIQTR